MKKPLTPSAIKRKGFSAGGKIGSKAKRCWICSQCQFWHDEKPSAMKAGKRLCKTCGNTVIHFQSRTEAIRYLDLSRLVTFGTITDLKCQPRFPLIVNGVDIGTYVADFSYTEKGKMVFEDVKGNVQTEISDLRRRLAQAIHGVEINMVRR